MSEILLSTDCVPDIFLTTGGKKCVKKSEVSKEGQTHIFPEHAAILQITNEGSLEENTTHCPILVN